MFRSVICIKIQSKNSSLGNEVYFILHSGFNQSPASGMASNETNNELWTVVSCVTKESLAGEWRRALSQRKTFFNDFIDFFCIFLLKMTKNVSFFAQKGKQIVKLTIKKFACWHIKIKSDTSFSEAMCQMTHEGLLKKKPWSPPHGDPDNLDNDIPFGHYKYDHRPSLRANDHWSPGNKTSFFTLTDTHVHCVSTQSYYYVRFDILELHFNADDVLYSALCA